MKVHYDYYELEAIKSLTSMDPRSALIRLRLYIQKYPEDKHALIYLVELSLTLNMPDVAKATLNELDEYNNSIDKLNLSSEDIERFRYQLFIIKLKYYCYTREYNKFLELYGDYKGNDLEICKAFVENRLGIHDNIPRKNHRYIFRQIIQYNYEDFLNHINKHTEDYSSIINENCTYFTSDFPLEDAITETKKRLNESFILHDSYADEKCIFRYDGCGKDNGVLVNCFEVVFFQDNHEYITMFPLADAECLPYIDLNYLKPVKKESKVRVLSPKEKFINKYQNR